ncbi:MAG: hypothetical protein LUH21_26235 [Clostridiales bacterium]|nr:hypothetical protein [Clostridiales bacterium]
MIKNQIISLSKDSPIRIDATNSIKYTLLLNHELPNQQSEDHLILQIMDACKNSCIHLFCDCSQGLTFNFFGQDDPSITLDNGIFAYLDHYESAKNNNHLKSYNFASDINFDTMILQHCILSSYHAILSALLNGFSAEGYYIVNTVKEHGIQHLIHKKYLVLDKGCVKTSAAPNTAKTNKRKSSHASDFARVSNTHCKNISGIQDLFISKLSDETGESKTEYYLQYAGLYSKICKISASEWRSFYKPPTNSTLPALLDRLKIIPCELELDKEGPAADKLYHSYLFERIFNFGLISCLIQNIYEVERKTPYSFNGDPFLSILCECKKFPNTFSRPYFIQYAFEKFFTLPNSNNDFWHSHLRTKTNDAIYFADGVPQNFQITTWIQQFSFFCNYLSSFVIPVYEWSFINILLESIEKSSPDKSDFEHLIYARDLLSDYMNKNYETLRSPIKNTTKQLISSQNDIKHIDLPLSYYENIFKYFFQTDDVIDLNLSLINPDFFLNPNSEKGTSPSSRIRDFYLELIRDVHFIH